MLTAKGSFSVSLTPADTHLPMSSPAQFARMTIAKTFEGDLTATSTGEMLSVRLEDKPSAGYVAMEQVNGVIEGEKGTFVLQHSGLMTEQSSSLDLNIVPDSGTGDFTGIQGSMTIEIIDGQHFYELTYSLS